jgi:nitrite reductase/ring-hydroxylating ferredoxin subunit
MKFRLERDGRARECFLIRTDDGHAAYVNRCPHVGTPLDLWPNEFFTEDGRSLICSTHGATFEPTSGACIDGPCAGDRLEALDVRIEGDAVIVAWPPAKPVGRARGNVSRDA